jgi:hypothetical protein
MNRHSFYDPPDAARQGAASRHFAVDDQRAKYRFMRSFLTVAFEDM